MQRKTLHGTIGREPMLLFGHVGVTLGAAVLATGVVTAVRKASAARDVGRDSPLPTMEAGSTVGRWLGPVHSWLTALGEFLDIRLVLLGSLLPDIIDKPLGQVLFRQTLGNGRVFSHTLLFLFLTGASGLFLYRRSSRTWLLALALGTGAHLVLDSMWRAPRTLLWPAYGLAFEKMDVELGQWLQDLWDGLVTNPAVYVPEIIGLIVMAWFLWSLFGQGKLGVFIRRGRVS